VVIAGALDGYFYEYIYTIAVDVSPAEIFYAPPPFSLCQAFSSLRSFCSGAAALCLYSILSPSTSEMRKDRTPSDFLGHCGWNDVDAAFNDRDLLRMSHTNFI